MCAWDYGTIYSWRPEMDSYQSSLPPAFTSIPVLYTIAESLLDSLLGSLLESLFESLPENLLERASHREE